MSIDKLWFYTVLSGGPEVLCRLDSNLVHKPNRKGVVSSCASSLARQKNNFGAFLAAHRHARPSTIFAFAKNLRFGPFSRKEKNRPDGQVFSRSAQNDTQRTYLQDSLYTILRNHQQLRDKVEKLQRIVNNAVKPKGLELIKFV